MINLLNRINSWVFFSSNSCDFFMLMHMVKIHLLNNEWMNNKLKRILSIINVHILFIVNDVVSKCFKFGKNGVENSNTHSDIHLVIPFGGFNHIHFLIHVLVYFYVINFAHGLHSYILIYDSVHIHAKLMFLSLLIFMSLFIFC